MPDVKILLLSTNDNSPGAARGAYRLHRGLNRIGVRSQMLVQTKQTDDRTVIGSSSSSGTAQVVAGSRLTLGQLPLKLYPQRDRSKYSPQWLPDNLVSRVNRLQPDLINLHWVCSSYLQIETLAKFNQPLVWTLRDMWAFTGGCHYTKDCDRYTDSCGRCPQLGSSRDWDLSRWVWQRKRKAWQNLNLTIVTLSTWLAQSARSSALFQDLRIEVIPNGLDLSIYKPADRQVARKQLNLPQDKKLVLFGAARATSDKRKGFEQLQQALQHLSQSEAGDELELVIFGGSRPENPPNFGFKEHYLGKFSDDTSLALVYSAADVFVAPSIQEAFGNTILEALACRIPCVGFNIGGLRDTIEHQSNGYLARPYETEDLARGISWILEDETRYQKLSDRARQKAEQEFSLKIPAEKYAALFDELLATGN